MYWSDIRHEVGQLACHGNTALRGGGGLVMWDGNYPTEIAGGGQGVCDHESDNRAVYGNVTASSFKRLALRGVPSPEHPAFSGVAFIITVSKMDYYGQTIASDSSSLMQAKTSLGGARSDDPSVQLQGSTVSDVQLGTATFTFGAQPSFSRVDAFSGIATSQAAMLYFEGTDAEVGGQMLSAVATIPLSQNRSVCPQGYVLSLTGDKASPSRPGQCSVCQPDTYSLHPLAGGSSEHPDPTCLSCPAGGVCRGGKNVTFAVGEWSVVDSVWVLQTCPIGYELTAARDADECENLLYQTQPCKYFFQTLRHDQRKGRPGIL